MSIIAGFFSFFVFLLFHSWGIVAGDSGDLVTAAHTFGIPHPSGYPLYTFLGWLADKIPYATPAWRVALLSSVAHALVIILIYKFTVLITKRNYLGIFSTILLLGNYLFFFYSVTPEVFAMLDFFLVFLCYLLYRWSQTKNDRYWYAACLVFGLSLSHHQMILFAVPAFAYWIYMHHRLFAERSRVHIVIRSVILGCLGLLPYVYDPIAGSGRSIINWDRPTTVNNFIRLITRADYGTFVSSPVFGQLLTLRLLDVVAFARFIVLDFRFVGVLFMLFGFLWLWKKEHVLFWFFTIIFVCMGPIFFFYASFPLANRFTLGTYERFLLPSYCLIALLASIGFGALLTWVLQFIRSKLSVIGVRVLSFGIVGLVFVYVFVNAGITISHFWGFSADRTADNLGTDLFIGVPQKSIIFLDGDTPLFTAQYVRYALNIRPDLIVIHGDLLYQPFYLITLKKYFPFLSFPSTVTSHTMFDIISLNESKHEIYVNEKYPLGHGYYFVPHGLLFKLSLESDLPTVAMMKSTNLALWAQYHNPTSGILSRYNHMMLSNVKDTYAGARIEFGQTLLNAHDYEAAKLQFQAAIDDGSDVHAFEAYSLLGLSEMYLKQCNQAIQAFNKARDIDVVKQNSDLLVYESITYRDCFHDEKKAKIFFDKYQAAKVKEETPLDTSQ